MRRLLVTGAACLALSGCASFSMDMFRSPPPPVRVQLESIPPGADAVTSVGPGCKTPCSVSIPATAAFSVTFNLAKYQPVTVPVTVVQIPGDFATPASVTIDPNPVAAELLPLAPPPKPVARRPARKPRPVAAAPAAAPFPAPTPR